MRGSENNGMASSFLWKLLERFSFAIVQLVIQIALARMLSPDDFGMLAIMLAFTNVGIAVVQSGLNTALIQDPDVSERDYSTVFWMSFGISVVLFAALFAASPAIAAAFELPALVDPLRVMAIMLAVSAFSSVGTARLTREMAFRSVFITSGVAALLSGLAGVIAALNGAGVWALVVQQLGYQAILAIALMIALRWHPRLVFERSHAHKLFSYGWKVLAAGLLDTAFQGFSDLVVGKQFNSTSLGMVNQGKRWPQAAGYLMDGAVQPVALSSLSKVQSDAGQVKDMVEKTLATYSYAMCLISALFIACAEPGVALILGEKWLPCVPFLQMYAVVYALMPIHTTNFQAMNALGRSDLVLKLGLIKAVYGVAFLLFAAFAIGDINWVVGSVVLTSAVSVFVNAYPSGRLYGYSVGAQVRDIAPAFGLAALCGAIAWSIGLLNLGYVATLCLQAIVVVGLYLVISRLAHMRGFEYAAQALSSLLGRRKEGDD